MNRLRRLAIDLSQSLGFVPGLIVVAFGIVGIVLVEVDNGLDLDGFELVFAGDQDAARTVLSVIAGSLITVAGLTFSITMVVLQLTSSQFSPRILRTFFADRVTQVTIGTFVGTFVYALLVLREIGSFTDDGSVPRLSVTLASLLGIAAVILLVVFLNHVSQMIQVSHVVASVAHHTLARLDELHPAAVAEAAPDPHGADVPEAWRAQPAGVVLPDRPGFVARVTLDDRTDELVERGVERIAVRVRPGDFVGVDVPLAEVWPAEAAVAATGRLRAAIAVASERDLVQDVGFGLRQLTDVAIKALSPGINDPTTAATCVGYLRAILVRLAERSPPTALREAADGKLQLHVPARRFDEHLMSFLQLGRYLDGDAWVGREILDALAAIARAAVAAGAADRARAACRVADTVAEQLRDEVRTAHDREEVEHAMAGVREVAAAARAAGGAG